MASNDGTTLKRLQVIITGNTSQLERALRSAENAVKGTSANIVSDYDKIDKAADKMAKNSNKSFDGMKGGLDKVGSVLKKVGAVAAAAISVKAIVDFSKECIELGSDLAEVQNVVDVTFGGMSGQVDNFAKGAIKQFGLSETAAKRYTSTMGAMLKSMGFTTDKAYDMSTSLTGLSADLASFYNLDSEEAFAKIRAGISGETEPLKQLGINMSVANLEAYALSQGIDKSFNSMSQMEQATLRYNYLLNATKDAQGDFARTSDGWANQTRILAMNFNSLKANIGQGLISALTPVIKVINTIIERLVALSSTFSQFMTSIFGGEKQESSGSGVAQIATDLTEASDVAKDVGGNLDKGMKKAEKTAKRFTMGFDELNKMQGEDGIVDIEALDALSDITPLSNMEGLNLATNAENEALSGMGANIDALKEKLRPAIDMAKSMISSFKEGFETGIGADFKERVAGIIENAKKAGKAVIDIFGDPEVQSSAQNALNLISNAFGKVTGSIGSVGLTIGEMIVGGIAKYLEKSKDRIKEFLVTTFDVFGEISQKIGDVFVAVADILSVFGDENGQTLFGNLLGIATDTFMGVFEIASKVFRDILGLFTTPITMNTEGIKEALDGVLGFFSNITGTIQEAVDYVMDMFNGVYDEHIKPFIDSVAEGIGNLVGIFLNAWKENIQPLLEEWAQKFQELWEQHLKPMFDALGEMLGTLFDTLKGFWETTLQPLLGWIIKNFIEYVAPLLKTVIDTIIAVLGHLFDVLKGLFQFVSGVIKTVVGLLTGDMNKALEGLKQAFTGVFEVFKGIGNAVFDILKGLLDFFWEWIKGIGRTIASGFTAVVDWVKGLFGWGGDDKAMDNAFSASAEEVSGVSKTAGIAQTTIQENSISKDDMYDAVKDATSDAMSSQPAGEVAIYMDGEKVGEGIDNANRFRNVRLNPVVG